MDPSLAAAHGGESEKAGWYCLLCSAPGRGQQGASLQDGRCSMSNRGVGEVIASILGDIDINAGAYI
jgi:hypothetical protein